jgi:large subunit ribosomal protein L13
MNKVAKNWHVLDLKGMTLGRVSTTIAKLLMGKEKATFTPNIDDGDYVIALNSDGIVTTGTKTLNKKYYRHSGFGGGFRELNLGEMMEKDSRKVLELSVKGMLPKNKFQGPRMTRLKVFKTEIHPYLKHLSNIK